MVQEGRQVVLFGGSFNPPHVGHVEMVRRLARRKTVDQVWVLPVAHHRFRKQLLPFSLRLKLCRQVFLSVSPKVRVKDWERRVRGGGKTLVLIRHLQRKFPHDRFSLALGADAYRQRASWYRFAEIRKRVPLIIFPRGPRSPIPNIASRTLRRELRAGKRPRGLPRVVCSECYLQERT